MIKKLLKLLTIPLVITTVYFVVQAFLLVNQFGVLSVVEEIPLNLKKTNQQDVHLLRNQKLSGTFRARENNLGILFIQLVKFGQGSDNILFRIKKEGKEKWYHESEFTGDQVKNNQFFPLGFPPITGSKNNTYVFELESLAGEYNNGIGVIKDKPTAVMYKYSARDLVNYGTFISYANKKFLYVSKNINYGQAAIIFAIFFFFAFFIRKKRITSTKTIRFLLDFKTNPRQNFKVIIHEIISDYLFLEKKVIDFSKKITLWFASNRIYLVFFNTNMKKRLAIGLLIFLIALTYRFSSALVNQHFFFYAGLGGQGDYDQFIRVATCAVTTFCSGILGQNFLIEASVLGIFYKIFGFTGGLKAYLYLMIITSSIVATLPYFLLSRKNWISLGGIIGGLYLATSDFLTHMSLNFPPDNGSLFTFSMFFIVYFLTLQKGNIRWLLLFGLVGIIDALNKALFILNDLVALGLFVPVFFFEKIKVKATSVGGFFKSVFRKKNVKILFLALVPLLIFLTIYSAWEYIVYIKFSAVYFLRGLLLSGGESYISYTSADDPSLQGDVVFKLFYLSSSAIVMIKRLIDYTDLRIIFLIPIFLGLVYLTFIKPPFDKLMARKFPVKKFVLTLVFSAAITVLLLLIKNNYFKAHEIFAGEYIFYTWSTNIYFQIFLFLEIMFLLILNLRYSIIKFSLPIIPYVIMLIILTKNSPFPRLHTHVVAWSIILLAYIIDFVMMNIRKFSTIPITSIRVILGTIILILFIYIHIFPKTVTMATQLNSGFASSQNQVRYLKWVERSMPENAVILAGGKSDLVTVAENIKRPIIYNSLWSAAVLIKPKEILGVKPNDFHILGELKINEIPGVTPDDFHIVRELKNKENFKRKKYIILEDDIYLWRDRLKGVADNVFSTNLTDLRAEDYSIKVFKFNPTLKKAIYELNLRNSLN